jgi:hypothetical protein
MILLVSFLTHGELAKVKATPPLDIIEDSRIASAGKAFALPPSPMPSGFFRRALS